MFSVVAWKRGMSWVTKAVVGCWDFVAFETGSCRRFPEGENDRESICVWGMETSIRHGEWEETDWQYVSPWGSELSLENILALLKAEWVLHSDVVGVTGWAAIFFFMVMGIKLLVALPWLWTYKFVSQFMVCEEWLLEAISLTSALSSVGGRHVTGMR